MKQLWPEELESFLERHAQGDVILVDVRNLDDYSAEHIPGSVCIPALFIRSRAKELDPTKATLFICERGAKSLAVALIYESRFSPEGEVYNLMGGLDAFMGRLAYGLPRIRLIEQCGDLPRMLVAAMDLEKGAWRFYQRLEKHMKDGPLEVVRRLAAMEVAHMNLIYGHLKRLDPHAPDRMALFKTLSGGLAEGGACVAHLFDGMDKGTLGWETLFEVALEIEMAAYEMYRGLGFSTKGEGADVFFGLAEEEKGHIRMLLTEIDAEAGVIL